ncbi:hypothetical protein GCM10029992_26130 [Glycomyces albus]
MGTLYTLLAAAIALIFVAGLAAMVDSALNAVSPARSAELAGENRRGAAALVRITEDLPKHLNLLILLRVACEAAAIALTAAVAYETWDSWWAVGVTAVLMTVVSFVVVGSVRARSAASTPIRSPWPRPARSGCSAPRWGRSHGC